MPPRTNRSRRDWVLFPALAAAIIAACAAGPLIARAQQQGPMTPPGQQQPAPPRPPAQQPPPQNPRNQPPQNVPQATITSQANLVNVDAVVTDSDGNLLGGLKKENFRILDNGQPQQITNFAPTQAPITMVMLLEFSHLAYGYFGYKGEYWAYNFLGHLNENDWIALKTFDLHTTLRVDFTHNRQEVAQAIEELVYPDFSEANLFDAVLETLDQLRGVQGKKSILVIATGFDTFSHHRLDQVLARLKETDVTIFCIGMGEEYDLYSQGGNIGYLQAKNQLNTFAQMTGGYAWFPRFTGEMPSIFDSVTAFLRNQYTLGFSPSSASDGKFHKLKVEAVDNDGKPLELPDRKGKKKKVIVYARQGYTAQQASAAGND